MRHALEVPPRRMMGRAFMAALMFTMVAVAAPDQERHGKGSASESSQRAGNDKPREGRDVREGREGREGRDDREHRERGEGRDRPPGASGEAHRGPPPGFGDRRDDAGPRPKSADFGRDRPQFAKERKEHRLALREKVGERAKQMGAEERGALREELHRHARRIARLQRIRELASKGSDKEVIARTEALIVKENERHERWTREHLARAVPSGSGAPRAQVTGGDR